MKPDVARLDATWSNQTNLGSFIKMVSLRQVKFWPYVERTGVTFTRILGRI